MRQKTLVRYSKISPNIVSTKWMIWIGHASALGVIVRNGQDRTEIDRQRWLDPSEASMADPSVADLPGLIVSQPML